MSEGASASRGLGLKRLGGNAVRTFVAQIIGSLLGIATSLLLSRTLGKTGVGTYAAALLLPNMLVTLLEFGITYANVYHIGRGDVGPREVMRANVRLWALISAIGLTIAGVVIWFEGVRWFPGIPLPMLAIAALAFPPALGQLYSLSILQGRQDFKRFNYLTRTVQATTLVLSAVFLLVFRLNVMAVLVAYVLGQVLALTITLVVSRPHLIAEEASKSHEDWWVYGRQAVDYGWRQHLSAVISFVNVRVGLFFVNLFLAPAAAGIYYVAIQFGESMWIISKVISTVLLPRLAELHNEEQTRLQLTPLITRLVFNFTALAAIIVALVIEPVVVFGWGKDFAQVAVVLWWLLPGIVMWSATRIIAYDFSARGRPEFNSYMAGIVAVINLGLSIVLIPKIGLVGAAVSTTVAYTANTFATAFLYRRFNDLPSWKLFVLQRDDIRLLAQAVKVAKSKAKGDRPAE